MANRPSIKVAVNSLESHFFVWCSPLYIRHMRAAGRRRRARAKALTLSHSREFGDGAGGVAPPAAAASARSRTPVNQMSDYQKFLTANQRNWRLHCAKSVAPIHTKRWQLFGYHTDVPKPLSLRKVEVLRRATAPYPESCIHRGKKQVENAAKLAKCVDKNCISAPAERFQHDHVVPKQLPKFGGNWRYRFCAMASPSWEALATARVFLRRLFHCFPELMTRENEFEA